MVADALDDRVDAAVPDGEPLTRDAAHERLAARRAVEGDVADDDVLLGHEGGPRRRVDAEPPPGEPLAPVVVGVALEREADSPRDERAERLTRRAGEVDADRVVGQARAAPPARHLVAQHGADGAVHVLDRQRELDARLPLDRVVALRDQQRAVEAAVEAVILARHAVPRHLGRHVGLVEDRREVEPARLPVVERGHEVEPVGAPDHLRDGPEAELGHVLAHLFRDEAEEVRHELGPPVEPLPELRILGGDANGAGVQMTDAHHDAAQHHERRRGESELFGAQEGGDHHVAARLHLAVHLDDDPVAQLVQDEDLLRLGDAELPGDAAVLDRGERRGAGAPVVPGDQDDVRVGLGDARRHRAHPDLGDELHVDPRRWVRVLQIVDQLGEVLDRIDVVMRRR